MYNPKSFNRSCLSSSWISSLFKWSVFNFSHIHIWNNCLILATTSLRQIKGRFLLKLDIHIRIASLLLPYCPPLNRPQPETKHPMQLLNEGILCFLLCIWRLYLPQSHELCVLILMVGSLYQGLISHLTK